MPVIELPTDPRLLLLDGHSLAYRAFFALPVENFSTTTGQHTNAVFGFTSMLINVLRDEQPTHIAVAFDVSRQTFRLEEYAEYKAEAQQDADRVQQPAAADRGGARPRSDPFLKKEGYEADDIIATLATQALAAGHGGADPHRRPRLPPAGHRRRRRCSTRCAASPTWRG